jgi:hypothetical protein
MNQISDKLAGNEYYHGTMGHKALQILYEGFRFKKDFSDYGSYGTLRHGLYLTKSLHSAKAPKYAFYCEIEKYLSNTKTLIIYHHLSRSGNHISQIKQREETLKKLAGESYSVISLRFRPYSPRAYFVISNQHQVINKISEFVGSNWKQCFELLK